MPSPVPFTHLPPSRAAYAAGPGSQRQSNPPDSTSPSPSPSPPPAKRNQMGTSVQVTPLSGAYGEGPLCYLLVVDDFRFLLDCGWTDHCDPALLQPLARVAPTVDAVLLSHPDMMHLGALPYAMKHLGLSAPVYATEPVFRLGLLTMYDYFLSRWQVADFDLFTLDDVDAAFQNVVRLKYSQNHLLNDKGEGIVITPHVSGHLLGGTVWKITKDGEDVVYAVDFNHRKEKHLNGTVLGSFVRPAVLITDAYNALNNQVYKRQQDQDFIDSMVKVLSSGGSVLLPVDTAGRVLELLLIMEQFGTLARMLQVDPPPKAVKVTMSKRIPLVGDELKAYEEEQERIKKEEALKASLSKEEELKASHGSNAKATDPLVVDASSSRKLSNEFSPTLCSEALALLNTKLVLVHGSAEATEHLKMHCAKNSDLHVYAPQIEETIDVTSDLCAYKVQLSEKLMSNVISKKLGEHEIAWVDAEVGKVDETLTLLPPSSTPSAHKSVLVGDLKLADFKQFLASKGLQVEFAGGALRCGEYITVRKIGDSNQKGSTGSQQIVIEGPLCEDYYKIRELLYSQFFLL
uniref:Uncharacterized protein n=1 Tax=Avena sativa TaxID=4498 RepID=A0ACD5YCN4_AVESA